MVASPVVTTLHSMPAGVRLLDAVARTGEAWLVGGAVRDLLLGRTPRELDVAVEGDVTALATALGGDTLLHEAFGTATVSVGDERFDLARTRTESYAEPGALPKVVWAPLADDLQRRDVSINAIAVALPSGRVDAVAGALEDLEAGVLRVLHENSFRDDPTRVWRIARYSARLGFSVDPGTAALASVAGPGAVSGERIGNELRLLLGEPDPIAALRVLASLNRFVLPERFDAAPAGLPAALATPRRPTPRTAVPAGAVAIGGAQTGVYPQSSPGGWNIIGRTPCPLFAADRVPPSLLATGDRVRFRSITRSEFEAFEQ